MNKKEETIKKLNELLKLYKGAKTQSEYYQGCVDATLQAIRILEGKE